MIVNPSYGTRDSEFASIKVQPRYNYVLRHAKNQTVIDADMICESFYTNDQKYVQDCNLYWKVPEMRPLEILVYNVSMSLGGALDQVREEIVT